MCNGIREAKRGAGPTIVLSINWFIMLRASETATLFVSCCSSNFPFSITHVALVGKVLITE